MIEKLWNRQLVFNEKFFEKVRNKDIHKLNEKEKIDETKNFLLHIFRELGEVLNATPDWKMHRKTKSGVFPNFTKDIIEELIDAQKFLWGLFQLWGVSLEEFCEAFERKSDTVDQRFFQEVEIDTFKNKKIVAIDIDGVLADLETEFVLFINEKNIEQERYFTYKQAKRTIEQVRWEELKHEFRKCGRKKDIKVFNDAKDFLFSLRKAEYYIALISARPVNKYSRIYSDTVQWLKENELIYDFLFFDSEKHLTIAKQFGKNIEFLVEDNIDYALSVAKLGIKVYLINREFVPSFRTQIENVFEVNELVDILEIENI